MSLGSLVVSLSANTAEFSRDLGKAAHLAEQRMKNISDAVGIDPYTKAVSDVNQDLIGEGSYHGKGLYDVRAFSRVLSGRFPDAHLLSHDLIEGAHVRVALESDIELLDEFPPDYLTYCQREHRWIRGDWQIADWIFPRVPLRRAPPSPAGAAIRLSGALRKNSRPSSSS